MNVEKEADMAQNTPKPDQDPAEGSREVIDRQLKRQDEKEQGKRRAGGKPSDDPAPREQE